MHTPEVNPKARIGVLGKRLTIDCVCISKYKFPFQNRFTYEPCMDTLSINNFVDIRTGAFIVVKSSSYDLGVVGERIKLKGTVSKHECFNGQMQTYINRVRIMECES